MIPLKITNLVIERPNALTVAEAIEVVNDNDLNILREVVATIPVILGQGVQHGHDGGNVLLPLPHFPSWTHVALCVLPPRKNAHPNVDVNDLAMSAMFQHARVAVRVPASVDYLSRCSLEIQDTLFLVAFRVVELPRLTKLSFTKFAALGKNSTSGR